MRGPGNTPALFDTQLAPVRRVQTRPIAYRAVLEKRQAEVAGRRSWDAYRDVFAPAYDDVRALTPDPAEAIAVVVAYVEYVLGIEPPPQLRALIARGVRAHGKAMLYGYSEATQRVVSEDPLDIHKYALGVVRRVVSRQTQSTPQQPRSTPPCS